ncbi:3-deoxy-manno-octulosonate cytidylyltransferase [hydrothermal vent metagenome]|uniref:3-deoxy-manno-octulosonate cytidylyltransferase n=1 Tax=hydrothermal vent metagenome TaxID=652676 RepID=A0A3B1B9T8_9ZZZZ
MTKSLKDNVLVVIPARFASTRLPGKPLLSIGDKPMIQLVYEQAQKMETATKVVVATDDERIMDAVKRFGGEAVMTDATHESGTDRVAEVARNTHCGTACDIVVNIQGDEPFINPKAVDMAVRTLINDPAIKVSTLCVSIEREEAEDPNVTCVVRDLKGFALYFSKLPIPNDRDGGSADGPLYKHLGTYVFRRDFLLYYAGLGCTPLEKCEKLEQLRILEHGEKIFCVETEIDSLGIDSPKDLARADKMLKRGAL